MGRPFGVRCVFLCDRAVVAWIDQQELRPKEDYCPAHSKIYTLSSNYNAKHIDNKSIRRVMFAMGFYFVAYICTGVC